LVVDATKRATLAEIANHPWMSKGGEGPIENYFPIRLPLTLPLDDEVIRGMRGFEFGTEDEIRQHLTTIVQSPAYVKASEQYARLMEAATSSAIEKSEKRKPFSLEFYKRRLSTSPASVSWPENGVMSTTSLQFDDPTNAFDPLLSIYSLVREKQERDRLQVDPSRMSIGLASPKSERALRIPSIPMPEAAHTGETSYEIASPPSKYTYRSSPTRSRTRSRGDEEIADAMQGANLEATSSSRSKFLDDITGTGKTGGLLRRISHKWSKDTVKESRKEAKAPAAMSPVPHIEIATPSRTLSGAKKSRETDRYVPSSPQHLSPAKRTSGLGRSTSISEGDYRKRYASAVSDDETSSGRRPGPPSPDTPKSALSIQSSTSGRARSMGHARHATISAARRANDRQDRDFWSGPLTGPSTIPEESKEAIRDIPSRSDSSRDDQFARPVHLKGLFSVATTSTKPVQKMRSDLIRVLDQFGISHDEVKGGFFCVHRPSIDLDSIHEPPPHVEEFSSGKKARRRLSFGAPIAAFGFGGDKRLRAEGESDISSDSIADLQAATSNRAEVSGPGGSLVVQFEIHIVKFPWLSLHGIQFKRVGGDVWQYKNACVKIVAELNW
jgi:hypothetical protein